VATTVVTVGAGTLKVAERADRADKFTWPTASSTVASQEPQQRSPDRTLLACRTAIGTIDDLSHLMHLSRLEYEHTEPKHVDGMETRWQLISNATPTVTGAGAQTVGISDQVRIGLDRVERAGFDFRPRLHAVRKADE